MLKKKTDMLKEHGTWEKSEKIKSDKGKYLQFLAEIGL